MDQHALRSPSGDAFWRLEGERGGPGTRLGRYRGVSRLEARRYRHGAAFPPQSLVRGLKYRPPRSSAVGVSEGTLPDVALLCRGNEGLGGELDAPVELRVRDYERGRELDHVALVPAPPDDHASLTRSPHHARRERGIGSAVLVD